MYEREMFPLHIPTLTSVDNTVEIIFKYEE